ncbi:MAG TPA: hypothetical protein VKU00_22315 [Chthonomonadaceae bacterium]|nr:hypothetical protein [Chthonomonadaceae bacterium]
MAKSKMPADLVRQIAEAEEMARAVRKAVREAVLDHKRAGNPVADWRDGKVVIVPPEEIDLPEEDASQNNTKT